MHNQEIQRTLELLKKQIDPSNVVLFVSSKEEQRAVATWSSRCIKDYLVTEKEVTALEDIWKITVVDFSAWKRFCGIAIRELKMIFNTFSSNGVIFPDGTVHDMARRIVSEAGTVTALKTSLAVHDLNKKREDAMKEGTKKEKKPPQQKKLATTKKKKKRRFF